VLFFVVSFGLVISTGETVGAADSNIVKLTVDGETRTLPTRAKTVDDLLKRLDIKPENADIVEPKLDTKILEDNFSINIYKARPVTIIDEGRKITVLSAHQQPRTIVEKAGIELYPEDGIDTKAPVDVETENLIGDQLVVARSKEVNISIYGRVVKVRTIAKTVEELLSDKGINLLEGDTVKPSKETQITQSMVIYTLRKGTTVETVEENIPATVEIIQDINIPAGQEVIQNPGRNGKRIVTYEIKIKGGKEISRKKLQEIIPIKPIKRIIKKGAKPLLTGSKADWLEAAGISPSDYNAVSYIIGKESNWNPGAINGSGCIGLGQRCNASILIAECPNWETDPVCQLRHFDAYSSRYGGWQGSYNAWLAQGWW